jgi:hypothetical protein
MQMGKDLHYQILKFFHDRMKNHNKVVHVEDISDDENVIFRVVRRSPLSAVNVLLTDAYIYGEMDYLQKPTAIKRGDFILIARPESHMGDVNIEEVRKDGIGIGKIGKFMGALSSPAVWIYKSQEEKEDERRGRGHIG